MMNNYMLEIIMLINIILTVIQFFLYSYQYLIKAYWTQIFVGLTGVFINALLYQQVGSMMILYGLLNAFFVVIAIHGLHRIKKIGSSQMKHVRDKISEVIQQEKTNEEDC